MSRSEIFFRSIAAEEAYKNRGETLNSRTKKIGKQHTKL